MHFSTKLFSTLLLLFTASAFFILPQPVHADDDTGFTVGGAVRYNVFLKDFEDDEIGFSDGQATWDTWRLNISGKNSAGVLLDFEYRFYPTFGTHFIHHGFFGYDLDSGQIQVGVNQVPFGDQTWASHSWWFSGAYYMGLEDDYDMGVKYKTSNNGLDFAVAYYFQPEPAGPSPTGYEAWPSYGVGGSGRYSYDIIPKTADSENWLFGDENDGKAMSVYERNQVNARVAKSFEMGDLGSSEIGLSAQYGQIYNSALDENGSHYALGAHLDANLNKFNVKLFGILYNHDTKWDDGTEADVVPMGAYGSGVYPVAAEAAVLNLGVSYPVTVNIGPVSSLTFYNDYTMTKKAEDGFEDTQQNILGFMATAGSVYTYVDIAMGKNQPWLTNTFGKGLGMGDPDADWNIRYNINIGYYF
jgi:hypothetical protein